MLVYFSSVVGRRISPIVCSQGSRFAHFYRKSDDQVPQITVPQRMFEKITKLKAKQARTERQTKRSYKGPVVISAKRSQYNHHVGQDYSDFKPEKLASGGWKNRSSKGDCFTINAISGNPSLTVPPDQSTFSSLGIIEPLEKRLRDFGIIKPSSIQALTIPALLEQKNVMCAAETGSGKTLAFLLPAIQSIIQFQCQYGDLVATAPNTPQCLIITPSRELADQIHAVAQDLCSAVSLRCKLLVGGRGTQHILREKTEEPVDILIATAGVLSKVLTNRIYDTSRLQHIVLDEADTLLDDSFSSLTTRLLSRLKVSHEKADVISVVDEGDGRMVGTQLVMVSATMPRDLDKILGALVPTDTIVKVTSSHLHHVMPHISQKFMRVIGQDKPNLLVGHLRTNIERNIASIVFVNKMPTAAFVSHILTDNKIPNVMFHGSMSEMKRSGRFESFQNGSCPVLVCTDIASRGLDTCHVQHVINYEFPDFMSDYIHRVGRVGRMGSTKAGFSLSFIQHKWEVDLLWKIETAVRQTTELHNVNANIKRKIVGKYETKHAVNVASVL